MVSRKLLWHHEVWGKQKLWAGFGQEQVQTVAPGLAQSPSSAASVTVTVTAPVLGLLAGTGGAVSWGKWPEHLDRWGPRTAAATNCLWPAQFSDGISFVYVLEKLHILSAAIRFLESKSQIWGFLRSLSVSSLVSQVIADSESVPALQVKFVSASLTWVAADQVFTYPTGAPPEA